jgi:hypothetical protein
MNPTEPSSRDNQETATDEILEVLQGFETNVDQLVKGLKNKNQGVAEKALMLMTQSDLGSHLFLPIARLSEPDCLTRLIDPLKAIEAALIQANKLMGKSSSPMLEMFVPSKLELVQSILADVQKRNSSTFQKEEKKK